MEGSGEAIEFHAIDRHQALPSIRPPAVVLRRDYWDDYTYKTTFDFTFYGPDDQSITGHQVKILDRSDKVTKLPDRFQKLGDDFCSLGQDLKYYERLVMLPIHIYQEILHGLNDVVFDVAIRNEFQHLEGFQLSLIRFSEAEKALKEAPLLFEMSGRTRLSGTFHFQFECLVPGAEAPHRVEIDFTERIPGLHRIVAFIGKNGTGNTQVLANLASSLSGWRLGTGKFEPERPAFSKVLALSYSSFDKFDTPPQNMKTFSYKYCGVRTDSHLMTEAQVRAELASAYAESSKRGRHNTWLQMMQTVLGPEFSVPQTIDDSYGGLSAGQKLLVLLLTQIIANIEDESIILFDEPETHLHPDALSSVIQVLHFILSEYSSYAIVATHSPIVLQEIPSSSVRVFRRIGNTPMVDRLGIESFGENLTTISNEVFESPEGRHSYRTHLRNLFMHRSLDEVVALFDGNLSLNALSYLASIQRNMEVNREPNE
jgi:predicted ATPase